MIGKNTRRNEPKRTEWLHIRLTQTEASKINDRFRKTACKDLSSYLRKIILEKPVTVITRNQSFDEFIQEMILLKNELSAIGSNLNQIAKKINSYATTPGSKLLMESYRLVKDIVDTKITEIKNKLNQFSDTWLQGSSADEASGEQ
ncbi:plasmid mobilization relaxosome protein MobC [Pedobacter sp. PF22-3]|uniref:plasmid mobilization protein n=1 Tax=Pedobacter sp. PF22-3 TaxID=2994467 RepID=UPI0022486FA1|nr:plasmid mobilization relaxosome protein MobC [Pedobacter sp. PF22-3]MCX2492998.1 plasmid mobilization relaxosome protein MobC [Pedobacter sp. PF22-3]